MTRTAAAVAAFVLALAGLTISSPASASEARAGYNVRDRFAREVVRKGDADTGTYRPTIEHVHELQYRLRWAGVYRGPVTGYFGDLTQAAVKRFQSQAGLKVSGVATHATWERLIPRTVRAMGKVMPLCRGKGWNLCYDRKRHSATLWHAGTLHNAWLVRGGRRGLETRTGAFFVYWQHKDHVSSIYGSPMPYSQFFSGGQAFHGSPFMVSPFRGHSHGCVNMYIEDARQLWKLTVGKHVDVGVYGGWD